MTIRRKVIALWRVNLQIACFGRDDPDYREVGRFPTHEKAEEFLASVEAE